MHTVKGFGIVNKAEIYVFLNKEEIEIMNNPITSTKIETVIKKKNSPKPEAQDHMASQEKSIKHLEKS